MSRLHVLVAVFCVALGATCAGQGYQTDKGTVAFLRYNLVSGGEFTFPPEAIKKKLSGSGFFLMRLHPNGSVASVTMEMSTGYALLDEHIKLSLKAYRFRPGTKQPIQWLVGFIYPSTVIVKLNLVKDEKSRKRFYMGPKPR